MEGKQSQITKDSGENKPQYSRINKVVILANAMNDSCPPNRHVCNVSQDCFVPRALKSSGAVQ